MLKLLKIFKKLKSGHRVGLYMCICGNKTKCNLSDVKRKQQVSCGCYKRQNTSTRMYKHGDSGTKKLVPEYEIWKSMKQRCLNPKREGYKDYGGRGISVCDSWKNSYINFLNDIGRKPTPDHSIDRINNDGNYEPGNCRWATAKQQANNTRRKKWD